MLSERIAFFMRKLIALSALALLVSNALIPSLSAENSISSTSSDSTSTTTYSLSTSQQLTLELTSMGIDPNTYSSDSTDPSLITVVEWNYDPSSSDDYQLYLYLYNPEGTAYEDSAIISMGLPSPSATDYSYSYESYAVNKILSTSNNEFIKYELSNPSSVYSLLDSSERRYSISSIYLNDGSGSKAFPLGKEYDITGYGEGINGNTESTLKTTLSDIRTFHIDTQLISSDIGSARVSSIFYNSSDPARYATTTLNYYSSIFLLPSDLSQYGTLQSVHYEYYKYRTNWIVDLMKKYRMEFYGETSDEVDSEFNDLKNYQGVDISQSSTKPILDMVFDTYVDTDDIDTSNIDFSASRFWKYRRLYNFDKYEPRVADKLQVNTLGLIYEDDTTDYGSSNPIVLDNYKIADDIVNNEVDDGLPIKNGYIDSNLAYIPDYSTDVKYFKYGYVNDTTSADDLSGNILSFMIDSKMDSQLPSSIWPWANDPYSLSSYFENYISENDTTAYDHIYGDSEDNLLQKLDYSDYSDDFIISRASDSSKQMLNSFMNNYYSSGDSIYRLTFDFGLSNYNPVQHQNFVGYGGVYGYIGKTDLIADFDYLDMTFEDENGVLYVLPAYNDPQSVSGGGTLPETGDSDTWPWWVFLLIALGGVGLIYCLLRFGIKGVIRALGFVMISILNLVYDLTIWWWVSLLLKIAGKNALPIWPLKM